MTPELGHVNAYLCNGAAPRKVYATARRRAEWGATTTVHDHHYGEDCTDECLTVTPEHIDERNA